MPAPAAVGREPQILLQPLVAFGARTMRQITGNRGRGVIDAGKTFIGMRAHEGVDFRNAVRIDTRGDIDEHQRGKKRTAGFFRIAFRDQRGDAAERGADHGRLHAPAPCQFIGNDRHVGREMRKVVAAALRPFGIAVPALIERVSDMAGARNRLGGGAPGMPRLSAAMQQENRRALVAEHIRHKSVAVRAGEGRRRGGKMTCHGRSLRNSRTAVLNTLSPTASM